jgi:hypothetical protein
MFFIELPDGTLMRYTTAAEYREVMDSYKAN